MASCFAEGMSSRNKTELNLLETWTRDKTKKYATSKVRGWLSGSESARRYGKDGIICIVQNPRNLKNEGWEKVDAVVMFFGKPCPA
jgi:hypothetical protein